MTIVDCEFTMIASILNILKKNIDKTKISFFKENRAFL